MEAGTITVGMGYNVWAGGENKSSFEAPLHLRSGTLTIDGKALVQNGPCRPLAEQQGTKFAIFYGRDAEMSAEPMSADCQRMNYVASGRS
jgi:hypothetical protein